MQVLYYTILPAKIRLSRNISASEKIIYSEILSLSQKDGYCFATNDFFAKLYGVGKTTVSAWISKLEKIGLIKTEAVFLEGGNWQKGRKIYIVGDDFKDIGKEPLGVLKNPKGPLTKIPNGPLPKNQNHNNTSNINTSIKSVIDSYNNLGGRVEKITGTARDLRQIESIIESHGLDDLKAAIVKISRSLFLRGLKNDFVISLGFLENNFDKVLSGAYDDFADFKKKGPKEKPEDQKDHEKMARLVRGLREEFERIKNDQKI